MGGGREYGLCGWILDSWTPYWTGSIGFVMVGVLGSGSRITCSDYSTGIMYNYYTDSVLLQWCDYRQSGLSFTEVELSTVTIVQEMQRE